MTTGISGILSIGSKALLAQQKGIYVTGNNIANVNTPGYTRQRVNLSSDVPVNSGAGLVGTGVRATGVERIYQRFPERVTDREELIGLSRTLSRLRMRLEKESLPDLIASLAAKRSRFETISRKLELQSDVSFYEATVLRRALDSKR